MTLHFIGVNKRRTKIDVLWPCQKVVALLFLWSRQTNVFPIVGCYSGGQSELFMDQVDMSMERSVAKQQIPDMPPNEPVR